MSRRGTRNKSDVDTDTLLDELRLVNRRRTPRLDIIEAVAERPSLAMTIDGASTLGVTIADHDRVFLTDPTLDERSWADVAGIHFELVAVSKSGDYLTLTFEDAIVAELRRHDKPLSAPANSTTRRAFAIRLCREARVPYLIDPTHKEKVHNPLQRSADGQKSTSWDVLGSDVAEPINWRRFSDGRRLVMGGDDWLVDRYKRPVDLVENTDGVGSIDFDLDVAKRASTAKVTLDTRLLDLLPGAPVRLAQLGPADGLWIVSDLTRRLTSTRGELTLTRKTHVLKEPAKQKGAGGGGRGDRDSGAPGFVPTQAGSDDGETGGSQPAASGARDRMVQYALAQDGKPYVYGASGPGSFDCSGLVQEATRAAGKVLTKPAASQWAACQSAGKTITVKSALGIRGALLFRIGVGEYNHVAISLGNGSTVEAMGSAYGCGVFGGAADRGWTGAALWL